MNKINVLHLISSLETGGAEKLLLDQIENSKNEVNYTVIVMNNHVDEHLKLRLLSLCHNVYFFKRPQSSKNPKYLFELLNIIKKHKIQIIHSHNGGSKLWSIVCKIINPNLKLVFTVHNVNIINSFPKWHYFLHKGFIDFNIAISKSTETECYENNILNVKQIYNGIQFNKFNKFNKITSNIYKIINVARINHNIKGQDVLIKALKLCKDKGLKFECQLVGNNKSSYTQLSVNYLESLIKELDLVQEVKFLGTRHDIPDLLAESDLFILPSRIEGFGLVVLEAMAANISVIASNINGPAELINHGENGFLFESENHEDLATKIMYAYENPQILGSIKQSASEFVKDFDINIMCDKYFEVYKELIKG